MARVIITNIRDGASRNLTSAGSPVPSRLLAADTVLFDMQVSSNTTTEASALQIEVQSGNSAEDQELEADFKTELAVVKADATFKDVGPSFVIPATLSVAMQASSVTLETGAPTPAPPPTPTKSGGSGGGSVVVPVIGAVAALASLAGAALWRKKRATGKRSADAQQATSIAMQDIFPESADGATKDASNELDVL